MQLTTRFSKVTRFVDKVIDDTSSNDLAITERRLITLHPREVKVSRAWSSPGSLKHCYITHKNQSAVSQKRVRGLNFRYYCSRLV